MAKTILIVEKIRIIGVNPYVLVTANKAAALKPDWRKPMPVSLQINGDESLEWRTNMMPTGEGTFCLYLHGEMRKASKTEVGDTVTVKVWFNETYRNGPQDPIPDWFRKPLAKSPTATANWEKLTPSRQKEILRYLANLKSDEAKQRNLARLMRSLGGEPTRFMGRHWENGK